MSASPAADGSSDDDVCNVMIQSVSERGLCPLCVPKQPSSQDKDLIELDKGF